MNESLAPLRPAAILCADIGGSFIHAALADDAGVLSGHWRVPTPTTDFASFVAALDEVARHYRDHLPPRASLSISVAGLVDPDNGTMISANIPCVTGRPLASELSAALGRPVEIANDADCFAVAEALSGAGRGHAIVFGAILGTGVGGGLVVEGRLVRGAGGLTGEWGHGPIVASYARSGRFVPRFQCGCGRIGCVDTVGGARGMERLDATLHGGSPRDSRAILAAWREGEPRALETIETYLDLVAEPLALVVNVTGAGIVPVGGGLSNDGELISALDKAVRERILRRTDRPLVVAALNRADAGLRGAALLGLRHSAA
ncbi:ROK family protein [Consotaella salsifontis]|uniref:N-acetylglucosamine kinase n=1 Tax=Consotaella salsifontis TaxID=1365950 RepID=A0A1T4SP05_9HYPH|nr:ROK family protein [Consotaella salsifontis]SKA30000.1 N-acetylglucosamine kinase [Consotaella salsifontis]